MKRKTMGKLLTALAVSALLCAVCVIAASCQPPHMHSFVVQNEVPATCTERGYKEKVCTVCAYVKQVPTAKLGHSFTHYVSNNDATCTADGTKTAVCDRDGCEATSTLKDVGTVLGHCLQNNACALCGREASEGLSYLLSDDRSHYIVTGIGSCKDTDLIVPDRYEDKPVAEIGAWAFEYCLRLKKVLLPDSIEKVGVGAFHGCPCVENDGGIFYAGAWVIDCDESVTSASVQEGTKGIGDKAFAGCGNLAQITLPAGMRCIGEEAFSACTALRNVSIPDEVTKIGKNAFKDCYCTHTFGGAVYVDKWAVAGSDSSSVSLSSGTVGIADGAFASRPVISFSMPSGLKIIGDGAFAGCDSMTTASIPSSVTRIGTSAFSGCEKLKSVSIPANVTVIGFRTFADCRALETASIAEGVTEIGYEAFCGCDSLKAVVIPDSVTKICFNAFRGCGKLAKVTLGKNLALIEPCAFFGCEKLAEVRNLSELTVEKESVGNGYVGYYATNITVS